ncbi:tautomerase family protein [Pleurocapsa sp. FMAR1]|uniref:tautomerase family protein n=1 Tax=Pleurocapsa sp. FMAR1 TaxID=3040204 RepID=UPI0029C76177|nr:hypothetical protein [Pleurocapsa sp. FMAR1]
MPLIYFNYPTGTLSKAVRDALAEELTDIALDCEKLPTSPFVKSTVWLYFNELPSENVYHAGKSGGTKVISLEVNAFDGGLDTAAKKFLIERFTEAIRKSVGNSSEALTPVYVVLRDVLATNFGIFGKTITLKDLHNLDPNANPI